MTTTVEATYILAKQSLIKEYATPIRYPSNVEQLRGDLGRSNFWSGLGVGLAGAALAGTPVGWPLLIGAAAGSAGALNGSVDPNVAGMAKQMTFINASQHSRLNLNADVSALRQDSGIADIVLALKLTYTLDPYALDDKTGILYQDVVGFYIAPDAASRKKFAVNTRGVTPENAIGEIDYATSHSWSASGGITLAKDGSATGNIGATFSTETQTKVKEFSIMGTPATDTRGFLWGARMQLAYSDGVKPHLYNTESPMDLVVNGAFTKWFKDPPPVAARSLPLSLLASFTSNDAASAQGTVDFEFMITQRIMYGWIAGRSGAAGARVGGVAVLVPGFCTVAGTLSVNLTSGAVTIKDDRVKFTTIGD
jgi:hypothetical protein